MPRFAPRAALLVCPSLSLALLTACVLRPAELDAGGETGEAEEFGEAEELGEAEETGTDDDTLADQSCIAGTTLEGEPSQDAFPPPCALVCGDGWGHHGAPLEIAWTVPFEFTPRADDSWGGVVWRGLVTRADGSMLAFFNTDDGLRLIAFDLSGETLWTKAGSGPLAGWHADEVSSTHSGRIYVSGHELSDGAPQDVVALDGDGELEWTVTLDPINDTVGRLAATDAGVAIYTNALHFISAAGEPLWSVPHSQPGRGLTATAAGTIAFVTNDRIDYYDTSGAVLAGVERGDDDITLHYARFLDDEVLAQFGVLGGPPPFWTDAWLELRTADDVLWSHSYQRASDSTCPDDQLVWTSESFFDGVRRPDGSVIVTGAEYMNVVGEEYFVQPWVGQVSADGELLARDRGLWLGWPAALAVGIDGSVVVLFRHLEMPNHPTSARRYLP